MDSSFKDKKLYKEKNVAGLVELLSASTPYSPGFHIARFWGFYPHDLVTVKETQGVECLL